MRIKDLRGLTRDFAECSFHLQGLESLRATLKSEYGKEANCRHWNLTSEQWRQAIQAAIEEKEARQ